MAKKARKSRKKKGKVSPAPKALGGKKIDGITRIKVVGIGGAGNHIVSRMMEGDRPRGVEFVAVNTDTQDLDYSTAHKKIYIGKALTKGLGAGMNPEIGKQAAEENRSEIGEALDGADIIFLTGGMGGGTGSGAMPVIAEIAKDKGVLTLAVVTKPFSFEGTQRAVIAQEGIARLKDKVDALVVIPNDRIFTVIQKDTPVIKAFSYIDDVLKQAVRALAELINMPGIINVDFADIKSVLCEAGTTLIGIGTASGQDRGIKAVSAAVSSPLLEVTLDGAKGVLFSIAGSRDLRMSEINDIAKAISASLDSGAKVIFGAYYDRNLKDKALKVTVIATGFNGMFREKSSMPDLFMAEEAPKRSDHFLNPAKREAESKKQTDFDAIIAEEIEEGVRKTKPEKETKREPWEIPAFLRKKKK